MQVVREFFHQDCKVTVFHWNGKYIIKLERDQMEQTYKVSELDLAGDDSMIQMLDEEFMTNVSRQFEEMQKSFTETLRRHA
jgi:hypothetical protein